LKGKKKKTIGKKKFFFSYAHIDIGGTMMRKAGGYLPT
jgi:hypothetical protein